MFDEQDLARVAAVGWSGTKLEVNDILWLVRKIRDKMPGLEKDLKETLFTELNFVCYTATTVELPESMELNNLTHCYARRDNQPSLL